MTGRFVHRHRSTAARAALAPIKRPMDVICRLRVDGMSKGVRVTEFAGENTTNNYRTDLLRMIHGSAVHRVVLCRNAAEDQQRVRATGLAYERLVTA